MDQTPEPARTFTPATGRDSGQSRASDHVVQTLNAVNMSSDQLTLR
jgi:hypothetical protein